MAVFLLKRIIYWLTEKSNLQYHMHKGTQELKEFEEAFDAFLVQ